MQQHKDTEIETRSGGAEEVKEHSGFEFFSSVIADAVNALQETSSESYSDFNEWAEERNEQDNETTTKMLHVGEQPTPALLELLGRPAEVHVTGASASPSTSRCCAIIAFAEFREEATRVVQRCAERQEKVDWALVLRCSASAALLSAVWPALHAAGYTQNLERPVRLHVAWSWDVEALGSAVFEEHFMLEPVGGCLCSESPATAALTRVTGPRMIHCAAVERCVADGANLSFVMPWSGESLLHRLLSRSSVDCVQAALRTSAPLDFTIQDSQGRTPLHALTLNDACGDTLQMVLERVRVRRHSTVPPHPPDTVDWEVLDQQGLNFVSLAAKLGRFMPLWRVLQANADVAHSGGGARVRLTAALPRRDREALADEDVQRLWLAAGVELSAPHTALLRRFCCPGREEDPTPPDSDTLRRLVAAGADVTLLEPRHGRPLLEVALRSWPVESLAPLLQTEDHVDFLVMIYSLCWRQSAAEVTGAILLILDRLAQHPTEHVNWAKFLVSCGKTALLSVVWPALHAAGYTQNLERPVRLHVAWSWDVEALGSAVFEEHFMLEPVGGCLCSESPATAALTRVTGPRMIHCAAVERCVADGANLSFVMPWSGESLLHRLLSRSSVDCVQAALRTSAPLDFTIQDSQGRTPLAAVFERRQQVEIGAILAFILHRVERNMSDVVHFGAVEQQQGRGRASDLLDVAAEMGMVSTVWPLVADEAHYADQVDGIQLAVPIHRADWEALDSAGKLMFQRIRFHLFNRAGFFVARRGRRSSPSHGMGFQLFSAVEWMNRSSFFVAFSVEDVLKRVALSQTQQLPKQQNRSQLLQFNGLLSCPYSISPFPHIFETLGFYLSTSRTTDLSSVLYASRWLLAVSPFLLDIRSRTLQQPYFSNAQLVGGVIPYLGFMLKDVGARLALMAHGIETSREIYPMCRHQNVRAYRGLLPNTTDAAFISPNAFVTGNVILGHDTCVFYHTVLRNYHTRQPTEVGDATVLLDRATIMGQVRVGSHSIIGIGATLDCCEVGDEVYVGHGASVALGAVLENGCIVAAGSAIPKDARVYSGELWAGNPAQKIADVEPEQLLKVKENLQRYLASGKSHAAAVAAQYQATAELDEGWLKKMMQRMEQQQQQVTLKNKVDIPLEARRFLEPRVYQRRPEMHQRTSYPVNRVAPWMPKVADQTANA
eukprot:gene11396-7901_t